MNCLERTRSGRGTGYGAVSSMGVLLDWIWGRIKYGGATSSTENADDKYAHVYTY
jgi:hypothetical protein